MDYKRSQIFILNLNQASGLGVHVRYSTDKSADLIGTKSRPQANKNTNSILKKYNIGF